MYSIPQLVSGDPDDSAADEVILGVDTHSDVPVAAVITALGVLVGTAHFPATAAGYRALVGWVGTLGMLRRAGVEAPVPMVQRWPGTCGRPGSKPVKRFDTTTSQAENIPPTANVRKLPPLIPLPEAAQLLGIPRALAYRYAQAGTLPVKRFGRRVYVITAKLQDLFEPMSSGRDAA